MVLPAKPLPMAQAEPAVAPALIRGCPRAPPPGLCTLLRLHAAMPRAQRLPFSVSGGDGRPVRGLEGVRRREGSAVRNISVASALINSPSPLPRAPPPRCRPPELPRIQGRRAPRRSLGAGHAAESGGKR